MILIDTNLLGRLTDATDPQYAIARQAIRVLCAGADRPVLVPQNIYEFWSVSTRSLGPPPSGQNGLGMTPSRALLWVRFFRRRFELLPDRPQLLDRLLALVDQLGIRGNKSHDARLVAAMQTYGISRILTFNANDFRKFPITVIDPVSL